MAHDDRRGAPGHGGVVPASVLTSVVASAMTVYAPSRRPQDLPAGGEPETVEVPSVIGITPDEQDPGPASAPSAAARSASSSTTVTDQS